MIPDRYIILDPDEDINASFISTPATEEKVIEAAINISSLERLPVRVYRLVLVGGAIRSRAKYLGIQKLTVSRRKPATRADHTKLREPFEDVEPVSQEPDAAGRALIGKGIDPCSMAGEIVGIISGVERAERERARQERIEADRTPCAGKKKGAIAEAIERIMAYVKWNPECRTTSVSKAVGCCRSVAFDRLCRLEDDGKVTHYKHNNVAYWSVV